MRLPPEQPRRTWVALLLYAVVGGAGATALVLFNGRFLGGVLALMWLEALAIPLAVVVFDRRREQG